jgi:hypothetical protein
MYRKDDLQITTQAQQNDEDGWDGAGPINDCRTLKRHGFGSSVAAVGMTYLPHSCEEWVIGGRKEIEMLIADLQKALSRI